MKRNLMKQIALAGVGAAVLANAAAASAQDAAAGATATNTTGAAATATTTTPAAAVATTTPSWLNRVTLGGDLRLRLDQVNNKGTQDFREMVRARLSTVGQVNESLTANFRMMATSAYAANSSNLTFDNYAMKKNVGLDIASLDWKVYHALVLTGGKAVNPFFSAGKNEMVFDVDVTLEGYNAKWAMEFGAFKPFLTVGHAFLDDFTGTASDAHLFGSQVGTGFKSDMAIATIAASNYVFNSVQGSPIGEKNLPDAPGNTLDNTRLANKFNLLAVDAEIGLDLGGSPLAVYGTWVQNSEPSVNNEGMLGGVRFGKVKEAGNWQVDYNYRDVKADAVVAYLSDSDAIGGGTAVRGHKLALQYMVATNTTVGTNLYFGHKNTATNATFYERYQLDLAASF